MKRRSPEDDFTPVGVMIDIPSRAVEVEGESSDEDSPRGAGRGGGERDSSSKIAASTPTTTAAKQSLVVQETLNMSLLKEAPLRLQEATTSGFTRAGVQEVEVLVKQAVTVIQAQDMGRAEAFDSARLDGLDTMIGIVIDAASSCPDAFNPPIQGDLELLKSEWSRFSSIGIDGEMKKPITGRKSSPLPASGKEVGVDAFVDGDPLSDILGGGKTMRDTSQLISHASHLKSLGSVIKIEAPCSNRVKHAVIESKGTSVFLFILQLLLWAAMVYFYQDVGGEIWLGCVLGGVGGLCHILTVYSHIAVLNRLSWTRRNFEKCFVQLGAVTLLSAPNSTGSNLGGARAQSGGTTSGVVPYVQHLITNPLLAPVAKDNTVVAFAASIGGTKDGSSPIPMQHGSPTGGSSSLMIGVDDPDTPKRNLSVERRERSFSMTLSNPTARSTMVLGNTHSDSQAKAFGTPSESMDAQNDNITLFIPGMPGEGVNLDVKAIHDRVVMIVTDLEDNVLYWNEGARIATGFTTEDVEGRNMQNFVAADSTAQMLARMKEAATSQARMSAKTLSLVSATFGTVTVRGTVTAVTINDRRGQKVVGHAVVASEVEDSTQRTQSMLHNFALNELVQEVGLLSRNVGVTTQGNRTWAIMEKFKWNNMNAAASAVVEWSNVTVQNILEASLRNRHQFIDVRVAATVPHTLLCDLYTIGPALSKLMSGCSGKSRIEVTCREVKHGVSQVAILITLKDGQKFDPARVEAASNSLVAVCGDCVELSGGLGLFTFPFMTDAAAVLGQSQSGPSASPSGSINGKTDFPVTVLLIEKSPVYRQNIILALLPIGHSFSWAESARKALGSLENNGSDFAAIILDIDQNQGDVDEVLHYVEAHCPHLVIILSSERPRIDDAEVGGKVWLSKPINRQTVEMVMMQVAHKAKERKEKEDLEKKQKEVLGTVRTIPWTRGKALGSGAFANVYEAQATMTGARMAVKMIRVKDQDPATVDRLVNEVQILCKLSHPNIIHYFYCEMADTTLNLFMELAQKGTLADVLRSTGGSQMSETQLARNTKQILQAVSYLHDQGIVHRDLKPANMLLTENNILKLTDFGTATTQDDLNDTEGTIYYMAPEVIDGKTYGRPCDIWSMGCVMCEMLGVERNPLVQPVPKDSQFPSTLSRVARQFISLCMKVNPDERPSAGTLLLHDFIVEHAVGSSMSLQRQNSAGLKVTATMPQASTGQAKDQWTVGDQSHVDSGSEGGGSDSTPSW